MNDWTDSQLLRCYAESRSEEAFACLVHRHVDFVYSAARRIVCDPHLAEDVTQGVFVALAQNAAKLTGRPVLSGWLHRTAQNIASQTVRTTERRRAREQEATAMNELLTAESDSSWQDIAPHLDAALGELDETDRDALLLRYFERKSAREMARTLGVSDEAAQKRVNRAVERLRAGFAKRGLAVGAGGLAAVISANAVQAAPAGLALTILNTSTLTGTAVAATTVKTIAMTTLQKTLVTATIAIAAGVAIYKAREAAQMSEQVQILANQPAAISPQLDQLQRAYAEASNRLATASAENDRLKSSVDQNELLKLRGQVGQLRQQLSALGVKTNSTGSEFAKLLANPDPATKDLMNQQARRIIKLRFTELFEELKLSPEQIDTFAQTYANSGLSGRDESDVQSRLRNLLGEAGYARFQEFEKEVPVRATLEQLKSQLGGNQLTAEQSSRLWQIVKAEPYDLTYGIEGDLPEALQGSPDEVARHLQQVAESNQRIAQQAGTFLEPGQLAALNLILTNALKTKTAQAATLKKQ